MSSTMLTGPGSGWLYLLGRALPPDEWEVRAYAAVWGDRTWHAVRAEADVTVCGRAATGKRGSQPFTMCQSCGALLVEDGQALSLPSFVVSAATSAYRRKKRQEAEQVATLFTGNRRREVERVTT